MKLSDIEKIESMLIKGKQSKQFVAHLSQEMAFDLLRKATLCDRVRWLWMDIKHKIAGE
jgi:hypothetical protein